MNTEAIVRCVESRRDEIISLAQQLVRTNTVNPYSGDPPERCGGEAAGQAVIESNQRLEISLVDLRKEIAAVGEKFNRK